MEDNGSRTLLIVVIVVGLAAGAWLFRDLWMPVEAPPPPPLAEPGPAEPAPALEPLYPVAPIQPRDAGGELIPLPPLEDSDEYFALALVDLFGPDLDGLLAEDLLIERTVGTVDNLGRGRVPERIHPVSRLPGSFVVEGSGEETGYFMSPRNYDRYNDVVAMLEQAPAADLVETYRRFYPLMNEAYRLLGYPEGHFNDRAVEIVDLLLATPEPAGPIELVRDKVLYEYQDPALESLASGQKMLLRMGPANAARVKTMLRALRAELTVPAEAD
jgi:hypothetical protein